jgi:hypothetical protein
MHKIIAPILESDELPGFDDSKPVYLTTESLQSHMESISNVRTEHMRIKRRNQRIKRREYKVAEEKNQPPRSEINETTSEDPVSEEPATSQTSEEEEETQ